MGHVRLGVLSKSRKWQQVVAELRLGADVGVVAASAADAAEASLQTASKDPAFLHSFWLLTQIPLAARGPAFAEELRRLGLAVPNRPSLMDVAAAFSGAVDRYAHQGGGRTDLGEMAQMAAVESLTATVGPTLPSLFAATTRGSSACDRTPLRWRSVQCTGTRVLRPPDPAQPRLLSQSRAVKPHRSRSLIRSRSASATADRIVKTNLAMPLQVTSPPRSIM
jgi:hypothetical protein